MAELTAQQRQFLDNYVRNHSIKGRGKKNDAKDFLRRMDKIEKELARLPAWETDGFLQSMGQADLKANGGDFSGAYHDLKQVKKDARRRANAYDPANDLNTLGTEVTQCLAAATPAIQAIDNLRDDPACKTHPASDAKGLVQDLVGRHTLKPVTDFLDRFSQTRSRVRSRVDELARFDKPQATAILQRLDDGFAQLAYLPGKDGKPRAVEQIRREAVEHCVRVYTTHHAGDLSRGEQAKDSISNKKTAESKPKKFREVGSVTTSDLLRGVSLDSPGSVKKGVEEKLGAMFQSSENLDDLLFDVSMKSEEELFWDFLATNKLVAERWIAMKSKDSVKKEDAEKAEAYAKSVVKVCRENDPNSVDFGTGEMAFGGKNFEQPKVLKAGAFGEVRLFKDEENPENGLIVKTALGGKQGNLLYEAKMHRRAMEGAPSEPGRKNIIEMQGVVHDEKGDVHLVLEVADAGNLNEMKETMNEVSDKLPEEARNLMNQFLMKQATEGVMYLRERGMIHVDLKEDNVFVMSDGTVKVADLGGSVARENNDELSPLTKKDKAAGTGAYLAPESMSIVRYGSGDVSTKGDTYALGKMARLMHLGKDAPSDSDGDKVSGALARLTKAMTESRDKRPTLEGVLESSYFQNLDSTREDDVRELTQIVIALGKARKQLKAQPNDPQLKRQVAELEHRMQEASINATRPTDDLATQPGKQMGDFMRSLQSTIGGPAEFCKFLAIPSTARFLKEFGVNSFDVKQAIDCWNWDMSSTELRDGETELSDRLEIPKQLVQKVLAGVQDKSLRGMLADGFGKVLAELRKQFVKAHGEDELDAADTWMNDLVDSNAPKGGLDPEALEDKKFKLAIDIADLVDSKVAGDCTDVLNLAKLPCKVSIEFSLKSDDKKYKDAPAGTEKAASLVAQTVWQRFARSLNQKLGALLADVRQYQRALSNGLRSAPEEAKLLVEGASKTLVGSLAGFNEQVTEGLKNLGLFKVKVTGTPFDLKGKPLVTLSDEAFPPPSDPKEEYQKVSKGKLSVEEAEELLKDAPPFTWLVREEGEEVVVSSVQPEGESTKVTHETVDPEAVGIGAYITHLGNRL